MDREISTTETFSKVTKLSKSHETEKLGSNLRVLSKWPVSNMFFFFSFLFSIAMRIRSFLGRPRGLRLIQRALAGNGRTHQFRHAFSRDWWYMTTLKLACYFGKKRFIQHKLIKKMEGICLRVWKFTDQPCFPKSVMLCFTKGWWWCPEINLLIRTSAAAEECVRACARADPRGGVISITHVPSRPHRDEHQDGLRIRQLHYKSTLFRQSHEINFLWDKFCNNIPKFKPNFSQ